MSIHIMLRKKKNYSSTVILTKLLFIGKTPKKKLDGDAIELSEWTTDIENDY
jgi:hypothetical protein